MIKIDLNDKVAIVTGSARGIGKSIALKLAEAGATTVISDISKEAVEKTVEEFTNKGLKVIGIPCNVSIFEECENMMKEVKEKYDKIDILVNNAGITRDNLIIRMSEEDWDSVINVNLKGVFNCSKAAIKIMMKKKIGNIINISSVVGIGGNPGQANYCATKGGVISMTKALAKEYAGRNIRINSIAPGFIQTEMTEKIPDKEKNALFSLIPMKKMGTPEDIANSTLFLASDLSSYITGEVIIVAGGMI